MTTPPRYPLIDDRIDTPDGPDRSTLDLVFQPDGSLRLDGCYSGPKAEAFWGDWDHEFWLDIPADHAQAALALIARHAFTPGPPLTVTGLRETLTNYGIVFTEGHWT